MKCNESWLMQNLLVLFLVSQLFSSSSLLESPPSTSSKEETLIEDFFICRSCGHDVSLSNFVLERVSPLALGSSNQTLSTGREAIVQEVQNTLGIRFKIIVVEKAYCAKVESWSLLHSWFPGYAWKLCVCPKCRTHLGWMFEPLETATADRYFPTEKGFYALISSNIISEGYRHINILSEEDQLFLNECEEEFKDRFTEDDAEFQAYCAQPSPTPPVLEPWQNRNHHGGGGGDYRRHDGGGRGRGRFHQPYHHHNRNRDYRDRPYNRDSGHHGNRYGSNNNNNNRDGNNRYNSDRRY